MSKKTMVGTPDPDDSNSWEEQVATYRTAYRHMLNRTVAVLTLPILNMSTAMRALVASK